MNREREIKPNENGEPASTSNGDDTVWNDWIESYREATPRPGLASRVRESLMDELPQEETPAEDVAIVPARRSGWLGRLELASESGWGRVAICFAALLAGSAPYIYAMFVLGLLEAS